MILYNKRITKALIRLRGCAGWSAPSLFPNPQNQVFWRRGPYNSFQYPPPPKKKIKLQSGSVENKPRSGRPKFVTGKDYRKLERLVKVNRKDFLIVITSKFNEVRDRIISKRTVKYHLNKHGFNRRVSRKRVVIRKRKEAVMVFGKA